LIQRYGFGTAFGVAAALAALALPYFLVVDRVFPTPNSQPPSENPL
ncbi:MAG: hypothetical protein H0U19_01650, partial [Acidobacteria bacterium]|nr:hypothetical protein [Acidobacteriota bacterium]